MMEKEVKGKVIKEMITDTEKHIKKYGFRSRKISDLRNQIIK